MRRAGTPGGGPVFRMDTPSQRGLSWYMAVRALERTAVLRRRKGYGRERTAKARATEERAVREENRPGAGGRRDAGNYTAGILDVFMERAFILTELSACPQGPSMGAPLCRGRRAGAFDIIKSTVMTAGYELFNVITQGYCEGGFCYHKIPEELDPYDFEAFERSGTDFMWAAAMWIGKAGVYPPYRT